MKKPIKGLGKKVLASALSAAMVVAFAPAVAMADSTVQTYSISTLVAPADAVPVSTDEELKAALQADKENIAVVLTKDLAYKTGPWGENGTKPQYELGRAGTKTITIYGDRHTLAFEQLDNDWNNIVTWNPDAKLIVNNAKITNSGYNDGPWNRHDINFKCKVELNNVISDKAIAVAKDSVINHCTISDNRNSDDYLLWVQTKGESVSVVNTIFDNAKTSGTTRGIKVADQYISSPAAPTLDISGCTFTTNKKAAVLVTSTAGATINWGDGNNISGVVADSANAVWVDQACPASYDIVTVTDASKILEGAVASANGKAIYSDLPSAIKAAAPGSTVAIVSDCKVSETVIVDKEITIDLAGHTVSAAESNTSSSNSVMAVAYGSHLTVIDTVGGGKVDGSAGNIFAGIQVTYKGDDSNKGTAELTVVGCEISGKYFGITGNGSRHNTAININGSKVTASEGAAIYHPQQGTLTINEGDFSGYETAVEIRAGELNITGGTFTANSTPASSNPNGSGTTTNGSAIAVAQHSTKLPITVNISGGIFNGYSAIYQSNPQKNPTEDIAEVKLSITGGTFNTINGGTVAVYSENIDDFITGGTFSSDPSAYVPSGYVVSSSSPYTVNVYVPYVPPTPPAPAPEVGESTSGVELPSTPGDSGTAGSTKVDVTVTDTTAATDSKGNKVDGSVSIDKIETTSTAVAIPETITTDKGTFLVTSIPAGAMEGNSTATTVAIPESVTTIGEGAFSNCTALTTVTVPAGVTEIAFGTFAGCTNLETVEIQGEVTQIASNAFSGCESLSSVTIPETVTTIGSGAFSGCSNLTSTSIPAGVTTIESNTFAGCSSLESVEVKGELTEIAADAFNGCESLTSMTVAGTVRPLAVGTRAAAKALVIPASVTKIGDRAFKGTGITSVTVPAGVKMGTGVFRDCKQLTKAAVASKVKAISAYTFKGCSALKSVTIPGTVTKIERSAFSGCKSLAKVTIPKSVTSIGKNALYGASKVKTLTVNSKKLTKSSVKGSLAGSKVTTVKVPKSKVAAYKKIFTKKNCGKAVKVRAI